MIKIKKAAPGSTPKRLSVPGFVSENNHKIIISQSAKKASGALPTHGCAGIWRDGSGRFPAMPLYDMAEESPASWNAKAARVNNGRAEYVG